MKYVRVMSLTNVFEKIKIKNCNISCNSMPKKTLPDFGKRDLQRVEGFCPLSMLPMPDLFQQLLEKRIMFVLNLRNTIRLDFGPAPHRALARCNIFHESKASIVYLMLVWRCAVCHKITIRRSFMKG